MNGDRADVTPLHGPRLGRGDRHLRLRPGARRGVGGARRRPLRLRLLLQRLSRTGRTSPSTRTRPSWQDGEGYGPDKAAAERRAAAAGARRARRADRRPARQRLPAARGGCGGSREGGVVPAPGDPDRPLQIIDARDLAPSCSTSPSSGSPARSTAPRRSGRRRWSELLRGRAGRRRAALDPRRASSRRPSVEPWMELPLWLPGALRGHVARRHGEGAGGRAAHAGRSRETVADIATWLENGGESGARRLARPSTGRRG